jgi:ABC-type polysaccharide transport system permease subunit
MQYSYATAINLFQSVTSIILVSIANLISKKLAHIGLW